MARRNHILRALDRLAVEEDRFLDREFLAPVLRGQNVRVRLAGVICEMRVRVGFDGFAVLRPRSHAEAFVVRPATMAERRKYLALFPAVRLILCRRGASIWWAALAQREDRFQIDGLVPLRLAEGGDLF